MGWIVDFILDRLFNNLKSTAEAAVLALAAFLTTYGITLSESNVQRISALVLMAIVALRRLFAKDPEKKAKEATK